MKKKFETPSSPRRTAQPRPVVHRMGRSFPAKTQSRKEGESPSAPQAPFVRLKGASRRRKSSSLRLCVFAGKTRSLQLTGAGRRAEHLGVLGVSNSFFSNTRGVS
jgi:hypothetical protein